MRRGAISFLLLAVSVGASGCVLMEPVNAVTRYAKDLLTFRGTDYDDPTEHADDAWITESANEGRPDQVRERDPDQWFKKYFMSEKARSIERNFGFD